jgi:RHS repeat-associated protein
VTYPNGQTTNYAYFPNNGDHRLQEIHHRKSGGVTLSKFNYTYDAVGNIKIWTQQQDTSPAKAYDFEYDRADQLRTGVFRTTDPTPTILKRYAYTYDPAGNRTVEQIDNAPVLAAYDNRNRITSQTPGGTLRFAGTLSEAATVTIQGNPAEVTANNTFVGSAQVSSGTSQVVVQATDPLGNRRTNTYQVSVSGTSKTFTFDANGNMTGDGTRTFEWDAENRLLAINQGTLRSEFSYDGESRRVRIVEKSGTTVTSDRRFLWCATEICEQRDGSGSGVTGRFFPLGEQQLNMTLYYAEDAIGSVFEMTDSSSMLRARYEYTPFGVATKTSGDLASTFTFTGHFAQGDIVMAPARVYLPEIGRWISEDPAGISADPNLYSYVSNSPMSWVDMLGEYKHKPGGPYHPPEGVKTKCRETDTCSQIIGKLWILGRAIHSHEGWIKHHPNDPADHGTELEQFRKQFWDCAEMFQRKCKPSCPDCMEKVKEQAPTIIMLVIACLVFKYPILAF